MEEILYSLDDLMFFKGIEREEIINFERQGRIRLHRDMRGLFITEKDLKQVYPFNKEIQSYIERRKVENQRLLNVKSQKTNETKHMHSTCCQSEQLNRIEHKLDELLSLLKEADDRERSQSK